MHVILRYVASAVAGAIIGEVLADGIKVVKKKYKEMKVEKEES